MTKEQLLLEYPVGYELSAAAKIAGCHRNTVRYAIEHGHLYPFRSLTGTPKIAAAELARWISTRAASNINS